MKRKTESVRLSSYSAPLMVAVFKDLMDYTVVLALPGVIVLAMAGLVWLLPRVTGRELRPVEDDAHLARRPS